MKKRIKIFTHYARVHDVSFEDYYDGLSNDWQHKAQRLQARRWRKLKHQLV